MGRVFYICLGALALLAGLIWQVPLSFAMKQSGASNAGLSWLQARGSVWAGEVTGAGWKGTPIGGASLRLKPLSPLTGKLKYNLNWRGPMGQGRGDVAFSASSANASDLQLSLALDAIPMFASELNDTGANFRLMDGAARIKDGRCLSASGTATTDLVRLAGAQLQRTWPDLTGELACADGTLVLPLTGRAPSGETFTLTARMMPDGPSSITARIEGADAETENALALYGFSYRGGAYILTREAGLAGRP